MADQKPLTTNMDPATEKGQPGPSGNKPKNWKNNKNRGKGNNKAVKANDEKVNEGVFKGQGGIKQYLINRETPIITKPVYLPITTRGIGFLIQEAAMTLARSYPNDDLPVLSLWRTGLAMAESKACYGMKRSPVAADVSREKFMYMDYNMEQMMQGVHLNHFSHICNLVNSIGPFKLGEIDFIPGYKINSDNFTLSITGLRKYLIKVTQQEAPLSVRREFYLQNSIPGATFDENLIMTNLDLVIPDGYNYIALRQDFAEVNDYYNKRARSPLFSKWTLNETGHPSQLLSCEPGLFIQGGPEQRNVQGDVLEWWSPQPLERHDIISGVLHSLGEVQDHAIIRNTSAAAFKMPISWQQTVLPAFSI